MAGLEIVILLLLIVLNGLLAASELAVVSARPSRLQQRAADGQKGAQAALDLAANPSRFLSTVQIGITLIGVFTGAFGGATLSGPLSDVLSKVPLLDRYSEAIGVLAIVIVITYLSLIIGELAPKRIALQHAETVASAIAPPMMTLSRVAAPAVAFLSLSTESVLRLIGAKASDEPEVTEEEIELLIKQGTEAGVFHESERAMVSGIFGIGDRNAGELMTPRHRMVFLDIADPKEASIKIMAETHHNFYPVCEGSTDNVVGIVAARELWRRHLNGESTDIRESMDAALFVPEIAPVLSVIDQMRHRSTSVAIMVDEYGGIEGLLTLNDMLSDVVGEIDDPHATNVRGGVQREDGSWLLEGGFPAHELRELFDIDSLPGEEEGRYETIGGFVMDQLGHIPDTAEAFVWDRFRFEVVDMDGMRIDKVLVAEVVARDKIAPTVSTC